MTAITSPTPLRFRPDQPSIFLAGSIENGKADNWQDEVIDEIRTNIVFYNPRRSNWDPQADDVLLKEQINWELDAMELADAIFMYIQPGTLSPISLLELGLYAHNKKLVVCCPPGFWRSTNVYVTCERYGVPVYDDFRDALTQVQHLCRTNYDINNPTPYD